MEEDFKERNLKQQVLTEKGIKNFKEILETLKFEKTDLKESWEELKEGIKSATQRKKKYL